MNTRCQNIDHRQLDRIEHAEHAFDGVVAAGGLVIGLFYADLNDHRQDASRQTT